MTQKLFNPNGDIDYPKRVLHYKLNPTELHARTPLFHRLVRDVDASLEQTGSITVQEIEALLSVLALGKDQVLQYISYMLRNKIFRPTFVLLFETITMLDLSEMLSLYDGSTSTIPIWLTKSKYINLILEEWNA